MMVPRGFKYSLRECYRACWKRKIALSGSANISDPNAGSTKIITSHDLSLADSSEQGASGKASNYELKTVVIDVAKRNLEIVGEKIYDSSVAVKDSIFTKISGLVVTKISTSMLQLVCLIQMLVTTPYQPKISFK